MSTTYCPTAPSSASVCGLFNGQKGAWPKFITHWALRSALIMPGYLIAGVRGKQLVFGALGSSTMISLFLMLYTAVERGRQEKHHRHGISGRRQARQRSLANRRRQHQLRGASRQKQLRGRYDARDVSSLEMMQRQRRM